MPDAERLLTGGRTTVGVVRIGATVRQPLRANSAFVRLLLAQLEAAGFDGAPRYLGADESGRETFTFVPGDVPPELDATLAHDVLAEAARLIRRFHDATAGSALAGTQEVVCHGDLSPCNFVFEGRMPVAMIDFDSAAPGDRLADVGYALFLWLNLGTDGPPAPEQATRLRVFCDAYGCEADGRVVEAVIDAVRTTLRRLPAAAVPWWREQLEWLEQNRDALS